MKIILTQVTQDMYFLSVDLLPNCFDYISTADLHELKKELQNGLSQVERFLEDERKGNK